MNIAEEEIGGLTGGIGKLGVEVFEDIELRVQGVPLVHIIMILSGPAKGFSSGPFESVEVYLFRTQQRDVLLREVIPHDRDQMDLC